MMLSNRRRRSPSRTPRWVWFLGAGAAAVFLSGVPLTLGQLRDYALLNTEYGSQFDLVLLDRASLVREREAELAVTFAEEHRWVPGATAAIRIAVANNSPALPAAITLSVDALSETAELTPWVVVSATHTTAGTTVTLFGDPDHPSESSVQLSEMSGTAAPVTLAPRRQDPLLPGDLWVGPEESRSEIQLLVHLRDVPELRAFRTGELSFTVQLRGESEHR